jgi:ATP:ADP antiporter, AAA family
MGRRISRFFDLRQGEERQVLRVFFALFLVIAGHTMLETARDALFLTKLPPQQLNLVYVALAGLAFVVSAGSTRLARAFGRRNALIATLCLAATATTLLHAMAPTPRVVMALYVFSGLVGALLSVQFWLLAAQLFTSGQARRLFGPIASGGVLGGIAGAGTASLMLAYIPVTSLLVVAAFAFVAAALLLTTLGVPEAEPDASKGDSIPPRAEPTAESSVVWSEQMYVRRVALLVGLSTASVLTVDYLFKSTAARTIPPEHLGVFFARYYAAMNGVSLVVQLLVAGRLVRRLGVAGATAVMPILLLGGGLASFFSAGAVLPVFATRIVDGGLRYSLNRVATELLYLPMPTSVRERAKGLIDTVLARAVQASMAGVLFALGAVGVLSPRLLAGIMVALSAAWAVVAFGMRVRYLDLFRRTLARGTLRLGAEATEIDVNAAEALVEAMASPEPTQVIAALDVLDQRHRSKLIPALILYHDADAVLCHALEIFGVSPREDWIPLGERLLSHAHEAVRISAVRALAKHGIASALARATDDESSTVQAYAAFHLALRSSEGDLTEYPLIADMLKAPGDFGDAGRRGLLAAIVDAPAARAASLVLAIAERPMGEVAAQPIETKPEGRALQVSFRRSADTITLVAQAMKAIGDPRYIPFCIAQLAMRPGREAIRQALVAIGDPALDALEAALADPATDRRVRAHVPRTIARFESQRACDLLMALLEQERDGFVRYKVLRGLGQLVVTSDVKVDRQRIERETRRNLVEYLRATAYRQGIESGRRDASPPSPSEELLVGLLGDKQRQSLARAFRLLKIAHKREDIHRVHMAAVASDRRVRSNAGEFLDSLLSGRSRRELRELFRLVVDDLDPAERVARAALHVGPMPRNRDQALAALIEDHDEAVATIASYYALSLGVENLRASVERARIDRPSLDPLLDRFFGTSPVTGAAV